MAQHGKKYNAAASSFDSATQHGLTEAVTKVKTLASAKFDETVELSVFDSFFGRLFAKCINLINRLADEGF